MILETAKFRKLLNVVLFSLLIHLIPKVLLKLKKQQHLAIYIQETCFQTLNTRFTTKTDDLFTLCNFYIFTPLLVSKVSPLLFEVIYLLEQHRNPYNYPDLQIFTKD